MLVDGDWVPTDYVTWIGGQACHWSDSDPEGNPAVYVTDEGYTDPAFPADYAADATPVEAMRGRQVILDTVATNAKHGIRLGDLASHLPPHNDLDGLQGFDLTLTEILSSLFLANLDGWTGTVWVWGSGAALIGDATPTYGTGSITHTLPYGAGRSFKVTINAQMGAGSVAVVVGGVVAGSLAVTGAPAENVFWVTAEDASGISREATAAIGGVGDVKVELIDLAGGPDYLHLNFLNARSLLAGGNSTLHFHQADRDAASLTGTISTDRFSAYADLVAEGYLGNAAADIALNNGTLQATLNADKLDGYEASAFPRKAESPVAITGAYWNWEGPPSATNGFQGLRVHQTGDVTLRAGVGYDGGVIFANGADPWDAGIYRSGVGALEFKKYNGDPVTISKGIWNGTAVADTYIASAGAWNGAVSAMNAIGLVTGLLKCNGAGVVTGVTDNSANWNTAYGWNNHALAGYLAAGSAAVITGNWTIDADSGSPYYYGLAFSTVGGTRYPKFAIGKAGKLAWGPGDVVDVDTWLERTSAGVLKVTGSLDTSSDGTSADWKQAHDWGDHGAAGYLKVSDGVNSGGAVAVASITTITIVGGQIVAYT